MLNLAIQLSTLLSGLLINFVTPAVFGLTAYGEFIAANALIFLIHKTVDIAIDPLIKFAENNHHVLFISLVLNIVVFMVFALLHVLTGLGSPLLLLSMLLSSSVILSMHAMRQKTALLLFQLAVVILFVGLVAWSYLNAFALPIVRILEASALIPALIAVVYLVIAGEGLPARGEFKRIMRAVVRAAPQLLSVTLVYNIMTNALPLLLSFMLSARDLGIYRIASSVVQSANALFPINTRAIFAALVKDEARTSLWGALSRIAVFYFSLAGAGVLLVGILFPQLAHYTLLAVCFPSLYFAVVTERYLIASGQARKVARINWFVGVLVLVTAAFQHQLIQIWMLYACAFALYAICLAITTGAAKRMLPVFILCPITMTLTLISPWAGVAYLALTAILQVIWNRLSFQDIKLVWRGI